MSYFDDRGLCNKCRNNDICKFYMEHAVFVRSCGNFSPILTCGCAMTVFPKIFDKPTIRDLIKQVSEMDSEAGTLRSNFVIEECAELIVEMANTYRPEKACREKIFKEACDVLTTVFVLLYSYGFEDNEVRKQIEENCIKALSNKEDNNV